MKEDGKYYNNNELSAKRFIASLVLSVLGLAVLAGGSILVASTLLQIGTSASNEASYPPGAQTDAFVFAVDLFWPLVVVIVWIVGSAALLVARRPEYVARLFIACLLIAISVTLLLHVAAAPADGHNTPVQGIRALFVIALFLVLIISAMYGVWQLIFRRQREK